MMFVQHLSIYLLTVPVFFLIDMIWLGLIAKNFYQDQLGFLLGPVNWMAAVIFYLIYVVGIVVFAILPGLESDSLWRAAGLGALLGFIAYCTYELTNYALVKDWPFTVVWVDILWGTVLTGTVAAGGYWLAKTFIV